MFDISAIATFTHDVTILVPIHDGHQERNLRTTFNYLDVDQARQFDIASAEGTDAFLDAIVLEFRDLVDRDKKPVPCSADVRKALLRMQYVRQGLMTHYFANVAKVKEGN